MDFHALSRRDLQALAKRNGIRANMTNAALADALAALPAVDGIEEYVQKPVAEATPAAEPKVEAAAAEEEEKDEEKTPALGMGRRRATRRTRVEPVAAPATRKKAAASKTEAGDATAEAVPARATRARSQRTVVSAAEEEAPKARRTSGREAARKASTEQEEEEKAKQDEGGDGAEEMEATMDVQNEEQFAAAEAETGDAAAEPVPARATRARSQRAAEPVPARATRRTRVEPVAAPATRKRAVASKTEKGNAAMEAVPARATRARSQRTVVSAAEEEAPKATRTSRRAVAKKVTFADVNVVSCGRESGGVSDMETAARAPISSDEGDDGSEEMEVAVDAQNEDQSAPVEEQSQEDEGEKVAEAVPARATRARSQRTAVAVAEKEAPKAKRTRSAAARKTSTEQEEQEKGAHGDLSFVEAAVPAPASSDDGGHDVEEMEAATDVQKEEQFVAEEAETGDAAAEPVPARATRSRKYDVTVEAVPARSTRARSQRTGVSAAVEEAPKAKRMSRRAAASKTSTEQEEQEKGAQGDVSGIEVAVPASVSSDEGGQEAEEMEAAMDVQNEEQSVAAEAEKGDAAAEPVPARATRARKCDADAEAVPARATRARSKRKVVAVAEEDAPKAKRTSRRAAARKTSTEKEEQEKGAQGDVSDMEVAAPAPVSSDEGGDGADKMEAAMEFQKEEQFAAAQPVLAWATRTRKCDVAAEAVPARATRARSQRTVVSVAEEEASKARRTSRRSSSRMTGMQEEEEGQGHEQQPVAPDVEAAVPAPVFSGEGGHGAEEMEAAMDGKMKEQNELVEDEHGEEDESETGVATDVPTSVVEEPAAAEACMVDPSVDEHTDTVSSEAIQHSSEGTEMVAIKEVPEATEEVDFTSDVDEENEDCMAEEEPQVEEHVDSSVQEPLVDVQQWQATEEIHLAIEDAEMVPLKEVSEATEEVDFTSDVAHASEENEDCTVEKETPVAEDVDSSVQEPLVDVQQCESIDESHLACDNAEMVPVKEVPQATLKSGEATEEVDFTSDVDHVIEENEDCTLEEAPVEDDVDSQVQELLVELQQCEATKEIHFASEDVEMVSVNKGPKDVLESGEATEEVDFTSDVGHANENEDCMVEELPVTENVQQCEATEGLHLAREDTKVVPLNEVSEATEEVDFTSDVAHASEEKEDCTVEEETPVAEDVDSSVQEPLVDVQQCEATEEIHLACEDAEMVPLNKVPQATLTSGVATEEVGFTSDVNHVIEENEDCTVEEAPVEDDVDSPVQELLVEVQQCEATKEIHFASEDVEMVSVNKGPQDVLESGEATEEVDFTSDVGHANEENEDCTVEELPVTENVQQCEATEGLHLAREDTKVVPLNEVSEATEEVDFTSDVAHASEENEDCTVEDEKPVAEDVDSSVQEPLVDVQQCEATEDIHLASEDTEMVPLNKVPQATLTSGVATEEVGFTSDVDHASEENEDCPVEEEETLVAEYVDSSVQELLVEVQQCEAFKQIHFASEDTEMVSVNEGPQDVLESGEASEEVDFTSDAGHATEETEDCMVEELPVAEDVQQCDATEELHLACEDTELVPLNEVPQATQESVEVIEEVAFTSPVVHASEENEVPLPTSEEVLQSAAKASEKKVDMADDEVTNNTDVAAEEETLVATDEMPQRSEAMDIGVDMSQATATEDEGAVEECFSFQLTDVSVEEMGVVAADGMPQSSATKEQNVVEVVTVDLLSQATVTDTEGTVKESDFSCDLADMFVEEEGVVAADEMTQCTATMDEGVQEVLILENLSPATVKDVVTVNNYDEGAAKQSGFTGGLMGVSVEEEGAVAADEMTQSSATVDASVLILENLLQATVTECAVKEVFTVSNLSQATVTYEEGELMDVSIEEQGAVATDEMRHSSATKEGNVEEMVTENEWALEENAFTCDFELEVDTSRDFTDHIASPMSVNVFEDATKSDRTPVVHAARNFGENIASPLSANVFEAASNPLFMDFITAKPTVSEPAGVPLCMYSSSGGKKIASEPVAVQPEKEVKEGNEAEALGRSISVRNLKMKLQEKVAVAQENEPEDVPPCIFSTSGGEKNASEPVASEREH